MTSRTKTAKIRRMETASTIVFIAAGLVATPLFAADTKLPSKQAPLAQTPAVKSPAAQAAPKTLTFSLVNPTATDLKDKIVEAAPGLQMDVGRYLQGSSLKEDPRFKSFFDSKFSTQYLSAQPEYKEDIKATGDRMVVERTLTVQTADPCAIPKQKDSDISLCFRPTGAKSSAALSSKMKGALSDIRKKIADAKKTNKGSSNDVEKKLLQDAEKISSMNDEALMSYLLNQASEKKVITSRSVVPFVTYQFDKVPKLTLADTPTQAFPTENRKTAVTSSTSGLSSQVVDKVGVQPKTPAVNPNAVKGSLTPTSPTQYPSDLTFNTVKTEAFEYLNGFTYGYNFADVYEVTFAPATIFTDRYYAKFSYDVRAGVGLRFPMEVDAKSEVTKVDVYNGPAGGVPYPARMLCNGVSNPSDARKCSSAANASFTVKGRDGDISFYNRMGLYNQLFDGKELVVNFGATATLIINLPGDDFDVNKTVATPSINLNRDYVTPIGSASATLGDFEVKGADLGLAVQVGLPNVSGYASLDPGIVVTATRGEAKLTVKPKSARFASGVSEMSLSLLTTSGPIIGVNQTPETWWEPWGVTAGPLVYSTEVVITPKLTVSIGLTLLGLWSWEMRIGPMMIYPLAASLGRFAFGTHEGTPSIRDHIVTAR